jgi:hypothetical protein
MRFGSEVDDGIESFFAQELLDQGRIADCTVNKAQLWTILSQREICLITGIGQGIEDYNPIPGLAAQPIEDEVRPDESSPAGYEESCHLSRRSFEIVAEPAQQL